MAEATEFGEGTFKTSAFQQQVESNSNHIGLGEKASAVVGTAKQALVGFGGKIAELAKNTAIAQGIAKPITNPTKSDSLVMGGFTLALLAGISTLLLGTRAVPLHMAPLLATLSVVGGAVAFTAQNNHYNNIGKGRHEKVTYLNEVNSETDDKYDLGIDNLFSENNENAISKTSELKLKLNDLKASVASGLNVAKEHLSDLKAPQILAIISTILLGTVLSTTLPISHVINLHSTAGKIAMIATVLGTVGAASLITGYSIQKNKSSPPTGYREMETKDVPEESLDSSAGNPTTEKTPSVWDKFVEKCKGKVQVLKNHIPDVTAGEVALRALGLVAILGGLGVIGVGLGIAIRPEAFHLAKDIGFFWRGISAMGGVFVGVIAGSLGTSVVTKEYS